MKRSFSATSRGGAEWKRRFKLRDESKEGAFASQTLQIKKLNHSHDALLYREFLTVWPNVLRKVGCNETRIECSVLERNFLKSSGES